MITISNENNVLDSIIDKIKLTNSLYEKIEDRYKSIGKWLDREESSLKQYSPEIYAQGSVRSGTAIRPLIGGCYDVDLVCQLNLNHKEISPKEFKKMIGDEIEKYMDSFGMSAKIEERKRCWTINYADEVSFHVDILPSILDVSNESEIIKWIDTSIIITDKTFDDYSSLPGKWAYSNPIGFSLWLKEVEEEVFLRKMNQKKVLLQKSLEEIPEYFVITTLRKVIMLLKRHRDIYFEKNSDLKPTSVLITTLAGLTYSGSNSEDTWSTLKNIVNNMESQIKSDNSELTVLNPANKKENFTDKWNSVPEIEKYFYLWLTQLKKDIQDIEIFAYSLSPDKVENISIKTLQDHTKYILNQSHRKEMHYREVNKGYKCDINKVYVNNFTRAGFRTNKYYYKSGDQFPKGYYIDFQATTDVPKPFNVYWIVTNTGEEAKNNLRGTFFQDEGDKSILTHRETATYTGIHALECIIMKDFEIVARSKPFIVKIK